MFADPQICGPQTTQAKEPEVKHLNSPDRTIYKEIYKESHDATLKPTPVITVVDFFTSKCADYQVTAPVKFS